jgi:hypothetical protein
MNLGEFTLLGTIQYKQTLPLKDHEVVIPTSFSIRWHHNA